MRWVNGLEYKKHPIHVLELKIERSGKLYQQFTWLSSMEIYEEVVGEMKMKQPHTVTKAPFNPSIPEKQIMKSCKAHGVLDLHPFVDIIGYYYSAYKRTFGKEHPRLSARAMDSVIRAFLSSSDKPDDLEYDPEAYHAMIDRHFQTQYHNCDYNICHFMSKEVRNNRFYETCY